ncbi:MAG: 4-hydroxy-tetrahydrodipicolinate reductase [Rhizobiales bacterium]|nr:4-hydroxy-tetrahydrodipicolinate reductase [Hyphomicrobiales bacterium]
MGDMNIVVAGAGGRMGRALIHTIDETDGLILSGALEHAGSEFVGQDAGLLAGIGTSGVEISADKLALMAAADGVLDFTIPEASTDLAALAAQGRIVHVIGTTGFSREQETAIEAASRHAVIIKSGNMSLGVNLLARLVELAASALGDDFDIEILEMHHRHKVDAPSGTAYLLGNAAATGRGINLDEKSVRARDGHTGPRNPGDIGFATLRGGSVVGDHSVIFAGPHERIELIHRAEDRSVFARGAVTALLWGKDQKPGIYTMTDVLGL